MAKLYVTPTDEIEVDVTLYDVFEASTEEDKYDFANETLQDLYDTLSSGEKERFVDYNVSDASDDALIAELKNRGYNVEEE